MRDENGKNIYDLVMKYGLAGDLLRWQMRPEMFAVEIRAIVKIAADLLSDVFKDKSLKTSLDLISKAVGQNDWATLSGRCQELKSLSSQSWQGNVENKKRINELIWELRTVFPLVASVFGDNIIENARKNAACTFARSFALTMGLREKDGLQFVEIMNRVTG